MNALPLEIVIATHNPGKRDELARVLGEVPVRWLTLSDLDIMLDIPETGDTFAENAAQKALDYCKLTGRWTLADDSGLCVDALDGRPGVYTARYGGGHEVPYPEKWAVLLGELAAVPWQRRGAQFRCVLALALPGKKEVYSAEGVCVGRIAFAPAGSGGFGYDPLFYVPEFGCTLAQLTPAQKDRVSHRGHAARALAPVLQRLLAEKATMATK